MATIAFAALGAVTSSGLGVGAAAALQGAFVAVGGIIDSAFVFPWLFPADDIKGQKIDGFGLMRSQEGSPVAWGLGLGRVEGTVIYKGPVGEIVEASSVGGKAGPDATNYRYQTTLIVSLIGDAHDTDATLQLLAADGEPIVQLGGGSFQQGSDITATLTSNGSPSPLISVSLTLTAPNGGTDLSGFTEGVIASVSGFLTAELNVSKVVQSSRTNGDLSTSIEFWGQAGEFGPNVSQGPGLLVSVSQSLPFFDSSVATDVRVYSGGAGLLEIDPHVESQVGAGNLSAFSGRLHVVLQGFNLTRFGNRVPQFTGVFGNSPSSTEALFRTSMERGGLHRGDMLIDFGTGAFFARGIMARGPQTTRALLSQLLLTGSGVIRERGGKIEVIDRPTSREALLSDDDVVTRIGAQRKEGFSWTPLGELRRPVEIDLSYQDVDSDNEVKSVRELVQDGTDRTEAVQVDLSNIALTREEARTIAFRMLHANDQAQPVSGALPPNFWWLAAGDTIGITRGAVDVDVQVNGRLRDVSGLVEIDGIETDNPIWEFVLPADPDPPSS
ncbi:phage tail protein [Engelhardtia mirabilis]|uniref:Tip attachment protein J domain-containing protein n=1 Tax=Engelhardtia mirabilis TaxID=2528011 RepID=A0A518BL64_9BACT|nr:hypothetical protein Pla133_28080 [Planctomycetes bacterium Pla133]QDV02046.1 hypothetical protein Pla86_28070 [Planctomycetes bacterium Pla86]